MSSSGLILEGVLAINKPPAISSAQVIRDVQEHFNPSDLFKPWIQREQAKREAESHNQQRKRKWRGRRENSVKMGHGGTLDPMATGVLILGVGSGTKQLGHFSTECTKSYETVVLFGAATDSYDTEGKVIGRKPYEHITKEMVEEALEGFKGKGMQKPPIFSALRVQGKRMYEYAREGKELPVEIKERPVDVHELEMLEWMPGGTHKFHWPQREAEKEEMQFAEKALHLEGKDEINQEAKETERVGEEIKQEVQEIKTDADVKEEPETELSGTKRKREDDTAANGQETTDERSSKRSKDEEEVASTAAKQDGQDAKPQPSDTPSEHPPCPAPACRVRMTVTSGFYVRSLCHDLGAAVGSLGMMTELTRTRQGDFKLGDNVLWYDELKQGEAVWGPKVKKMLESWVDKEK